MKAYTDFLDEVMPHVPGCSVTVATNAIRNACVEFCEKTNILQVDHDLVTTLANVPDYDLEPPTNYLVARIMRAWFKNDTLTPAAPDEVASIRVFNTNAEGADGTATPKFIFQKDERTFSVYPVPKETSRNAITMRIALKPTRSSTTIDDKIFEEYLEVIANGAKARLMLMPSKPYTNPDLAGVNNALFQQGINAAKQRANRGFVRSDMSVALRRV